MFFYLSKIFWIIATPLNFIWLIVAIGLSLRFWKPELGNRVLIIAGIIFLTIGFLPIGHNMMVFLETRHERPEPIPEAVDGIIVLGGAFNATLFHKRHMMAANSNVNRIIDFIDLAKQYPNAKLVFTGGSGNIYYRDHKEADAAEFFLKMIGLDINRVTFERQSRNTYENVVFSKDLVKPSPEETWILITSAYHMPRSVGIFSKQGWIVTPYPSSPKTDGEYTLLPKHFSVSRNFYLINTALKELIGCVIYYFSGKSAFL